MKFVSSEILAYCESHSNKDSELLKELIEYTYATETAPQMISGSHVGNFLQSLIKMTKSKNILEIGMFTGYSALKMAEVIAKKHAEERAKAEAETEVMADGTIKFLSPRYKYYEFSGPLATNLVGSNKILTINISVAVYETPMKAEDFYEIFEVFVPVLRSIVVKKIGDFTLEMAEDEPTVYQFRKYLLEAFNKKLRDLGSEPILKKIVFSSFVIT